MKKGLRHDEANEFKTIKALRSPNTWIAVPADYLNLTAAKQSPDGCEFSLNNQDDWHNELAGTLGSWDVIPPIPAYKSFLWVVAIGNFSPMNLDLVFDDRLLYGVERTELAQYAATKSRRRG